MYVCVCVVLIGSHSLFPPPLPLSSSQFEVTLFKLGKILVALYISIWVLAGHAAAAIDASHQGTLALCGVSVFTITTAAAAKQWTNVSIVGGTFNLAAGIARIVWMAAVVKRGMWYSCCRCCCRGDTTVVVEGEEEEEVKPMGVEAGYGGVAVHE